MPPRAFLGEFEQRLLLAILRSGEEPTAVDVRRELERALGRAVSTGAFYTTLDRLEAKDRLAWTLRPRSRGGPLPERVLTVTKQGLQDLRVARKSLLDMWRGLDALIDRPRRK